MNILLTGGTGFLGQHVQHVLRSKKHNITLVDRNTSLCNLDGKYDCLIHLAAKAHVMPHPTKEMSDEYIEANVVYTKKVASLAKKLNIKRFVFISSIKVHGNGLNRPFIENDLPSPQDLYSLTKILAEQELKNVLTDSATDFTIIRPPLIYGPNAKANFNKMIQLCSIPVPLPFGNIENKRSLINVYNLIDFIELCCTHPKASNETFLISDGHDVSTTELLAVIKKHLHRKNLLIPIPSSILKLTFKLLGKENLNERLLYSYQADISKAKNLLNWKPVISFEDGIARSVNKSVY